MNRSGLYLSVCVLALLALVGSITGCGATEKSQTTTSPTNPVSTTTPPDNQTPASSQSVAKPVINSFTAMPDTVTLGRFSQLMWSVSGTETVTIEPIVGEVPAESMVLVTPQATTTYTLTATNDYGTTTGTITVTLVTASTAEPATGQ